MAKKKRNKPSTNRQRDTKKNNLVVNQMIEKAPQRKTSDVGEWRNALKSADMGRVSRLFDLYEDLNIDGVLSDAASKRIDAVTNSEITFQNAHGEEVEAITDLMDTTDFETLLTQIMHTRFWGRAGVEFDFSQGFNVHEIPKKHIDLDNGQILLEATSDTGIPYAADDHLLILGKQRDFGLFLKTAPFAIWKRGGFGDYAQWLEIFGMPQRIGKYSSYDGESRKLLEQAFENAGSAPWLVVPKEADIETVENTGNGGSGASFNDFRKACNEEMLITVLGQTMTSVQGDKGARSLGEVHKEVEEGKNKSDLRYVQRILNQKVLPLLEKRGFPTKGGKFIFPKAAVELSVSDIVSLSDILEIPASHLHEKYSIPAPKDGEAIARRNTTPQPIEPEPEPEPPKGKKKPEGKSKKAEGKKADEENIENNDRNFFLRLYDFFVNAPAMELAGAASKHLTLSDGSFNYELIGRIEGKQTFDVELFDFISGNLLKALDDKPRRMTDLGFAYYYQNDAFRTAQELNVFHFSAAKTLVEITELNRLYRESGSFEEFYHKAKAKCDVFNKKWQKTEYQTATNVSSASETYNRLMKKAKLFPYWEYRTVDDERVREEHRKLEGIILPANDPRWKKIFPPNGWKCRCYVVPRLASDVKGIDIAAMRERVDEYLASDEWNKVDKQGFGINRALLPELFTANQMYLNKFPTRAGKLLKDVNYQTYKLGTYKQNRAKASGDAVQYDGELESYIKTMPEENGHKYFEDYNGRRVTFDLDKYLKGHKGNKVKQRTPYIKAAKEALATPDEVWITVDSKSFNEYAFIKYYKDVTILAIAEIKEGKVYQLKTWFPVSENKATMRYRTGLLIKKGDD